MPPIRNARARAPTELPGATAYDGTPLRAGTLVSVNSQRGPLPAVVHRLFTDEHPHARAHVQYVVKSFAGDRFLGPKCGNISTRSILRTLPGEATLVAEPGVWRDPLPRAAHASSSKADPFSPTSCHACLVAQRARDVAPRVIHAIEGPDVLKIRREEYHPGNLVFFESSKRGGPWTPGILSSSHRATPAGEEWGIRLCGWYADLPVAFADEVSPHTLKLTPEPSLPNRGRAVCTRL